MAWTWAAFMPHPPIAVPEVGQGREKEAAATLGGLAELQKRLRQMPNRGRPDVLLILSPHQLCAQGAFYLNSASELSGDLKRFGAPGIGFTLKSSSRLLEFGRHLAGYGLKIRPAEMSDLSADHGAIVPLYFLAQAFGDPPPAVVGNPAGLSPAEALAFGRALAAWESGDEKWALLASGDLSHRLLPDGPYGFNPEGPLFDQAVMKAFENNTPEKLIEQWPLPRLEKAGECGFRSALAMMGLVGGQAVEALSYEGPFGVGYAVAWWAANPRPDTE